MHQIGLEQLTSQTHPPSHYYGEMKVPVELYCPIAHYYEEKKHI